jgi:hypothetical protein
MNLSSISVGDLNRAIKIKEQIELLQSELDQLFGEPGASMGKERRGRKGKMSAAGRAAIAEGQRRRWAAVNSSKPEKTEKKAKRKMSAAGRARIAAAAKARWAKVKAEGRTRL